MRFRSLHVQLPDDTKFHGQLEGVCNTGGGWAKEPLTCGSYVKKREKQYRCLKKKPKVLYQRRNTVLILKKYAWFESACTVDIISNNLWHARDFSHILCVPKRKACRLGTLNNVKVECMNWPEVN